jgi:hypothetical protein
MPDYNKAKIYCIKSSQTEEVYYGSTCCSLKKRFNNHMWDYRSNSKNYITSKYILQYEDAYIELIEEFPCNNRQELNLREGFYIQNNSCVNKRIAGRTHKEITKDYHDTHKEEAKAYRDANKDKIKAYRRAYYLSHKPSA